MTSLLRKFLKSESADQSITMGETESWISNLHLSSEFQTRCKLLACRTELRSITEADEMATISLLIERLKPKLSIEIGTFFAGTSRVIAETLLALGGSGKLLTIDPYGGHRVPGILAEWPNQLSSLIDFRAINSMTLFDDLETQRYPKGGRAKLGLVFVDGNHNFEYALFDIIRSADFLMPGGAIVIDNMDQEGPRQAAARFLQWNPAWKLYSDKKLFTASMKYSELANSHWGVLLAPNGIQISQMAFKFFERSVPHQSIQSVRFNVVESSSPGKFPIKLNYHAYPYDYHLTGTGMVQSIRTGEVSTTPGQPMVVTFSSPAELVLPHKEYNVNYELEALFTPKHPNAGYILLDKNQPFTFE